MALVLHRHHRLAKPRGSSSHRSLGRQRQQVATSDRRREAVRQPQPGRTDSLGGQPHPSRTPQPVHRSKQGRLQPVGRQRLTPTTRTGTAPQADNLTSCPDPTPHPYCRQRTRRNWRRHASPPRPRRTGRHPPIDASEVAHTPGPQTTRRDAASAAQQASRSAAGVASLTTAQPDSIPVDAPLWPALHVPTRPRAHKTSRARQPAQRSAASPAAAHPRTSQMDDSRLSRPVRTRAPQTISREQPAQPMQPMQRSCNRRREPDPPPDAPTHSRQTPPQLPHHGPHPQHEHRMRGSRRSRRSRAQQASRARSTTRCPTHPRHHQVDASA
jgi:hypothetical protein